MSYRRKQGEILMFNKPVSHKYLEWNNTLILSILASIFISFITLAFGLVITYEIILILCIIILASTYVYHLKYASAAYTIGITYLLLVSSIKNHYEDSITILASMTLLIGLFLIVEAAALKSIKNKHSAPEILQTNRGGIFGQLNVSKINFIPFFIFVPENIMSPIMPLWPTFTIGDGLYGLVLLPFLIGFNFSFFGKLPEIGAKRVARHLLILGGTVIALSIISLYIPVISPFIVLIAIIGRIVIQIQVRVSEEKEPALFLNKKEYVTVFWIVKDSPAAKVGLRIGDTIIKVNDQHVDNADHFYELVKAGGPIVQLQVIDSNGSIRIVNTTLFAKSQVTHGLHII